MLLTFVSCHHPNLVIFFWPIFFCHAVSTSYRITLNFRGSKFSQIVVLEDFVEVFLRIHCTHTLHATCHKFLLKYFHKRLKNHKICEIKDSRKFCTMRYIFLNLRRYSLPVNFQAVVMKPHRKAQKKLTETLNQLYGHLDAKFIASEIEVS